MQNTDLPTKKGTKTARGAFSASAVIFALVTLFNPNVNLIDIIPDFIGFFILARFFERGADCAPYFEEASVGFQKLFWLNIAKIPAFMITIAAKSNNARDNDIVALMAISFAALELVFAIPAVKAAFSALFYLGERTDAQALINGGKIPTDTLCSFTYATVIFKALFSSLPEMLKLTRSSVTGSQTVVTTGSLAYPWIILVGVIVGTVIGAIWLKQIITYVKAIKKEGLFYKALDTLAVSDSYEEYERRVARRSLKSALFVLFLSSLAGFKIEFENFHGINILPEFIFGALLLLGILLMQKHVSCDKRTKVITFISGISYIALSAVAFVLSVRFLTDYGYDEIFYKNEAALSAYSAIEIVTALGFAALATLSYSLFRTLSNFSRERLLEIVDPESPLSRIDTDYNKTVKRKTITLCALCTGLGLVKLLEVFLRGNVQVIFTNDSDITMPSIITSALPWFNIVVFATALAFVFYTYYYSSFIKEELETKGSKTK